MKTKVFVSYAREDKAFVERLEAALRARSVEPLIDKGEIAPLERDWWKRIEDVIAQADSLVFVISPDSVASDVCKKELAFAQGLNKRLAPIVWRHTDDQAVPEALSKINYVFFDVTDFDASVETLVTALTTDIDWVRKHTAFGEATRRWAGAGRPGPRGLLLRSPVLEEAERWIASRPSNAPPPTEDMGAFIAESRRAATQRRNILTGSLTAGLVVALGLAGLAYWQRTVAVEQRNQALLTQSRFLVGLSTQALQRGDAGTAMLLALEALPDPTADVRRPYLHDAEVALFAARAQLHEIASINYGATILAFNSDWSKVITNDGKNADVWDLTAGTKMLMLSHEDRVNSAMFSPDGKRIVTAAQNATAQVWDLETGNVIAKLVGHRTDLVLTHTDSETYRTTAAFSPDGRRVVTGSQDRTARIWDVQSGQLLILMAGHTERVNSVTFSGDGRRLLTGSDDSTARIWDPLTGRQLLVITGHKGPVRRAVFSPDGRRVLTGSADGTARVWDAQTGRQLLQVTSQAGAVVSCAEFSSDGSRFATLTYEGIIQIWNAQSGLQIALFAAPLDLSIGGSLNVKYSPDDRRLVNTASGVIWSTEPVALPYHTAEVGTAIFSPNGRRILTASSDSTARIWDAFNVSIMPLVLVHGGPVRDATFSPDGKRVVTASADRTAKIWDADSGKLISTLSGHRGEVSQAVFSPDGLRVVTGSPGAPVPTDNTARIWDAQTGRLIATLQHEDGMLVRFSYDGSQVITTSTDEVRTWDALTGKRLVESEKDKEVAFSRSTKRLLLKRSESVVLVDSETGREIAVLGQISNATFTEDGRQIMGISTEDVQSWDSETGKLTGRFARPLATGTFYIAPNGRTALTEITGEGLMLWDVHRSKRITILTAGASDTITYGDFSPDGKRVLTTGSSARLFYLPSNPQDIEESRDALLRCLTPAQRKEYFLGPTPPDWCIKTGKWPYARRQ